MFGYMDLLIVVKWTSDFNQKETYAPSIINKMIQLFLNFGNHADEKELDLFYD